MAYRHLFIVLVVVVLLSQGAPVFAWFVAEFDQVWEEHKPAPEAAPSPRPAASPGSSYTDPTTGMEFVLVKGGCYQMGDSFDEVAFGEGDDDEKPIHEVCVDDFYIGKYEVTQGEWQKVFEKNPSEFKKGDRYPVEQVNWNDAQNFIRKLGGKYRLPTEAEWEYAARSGGKKEKYAGGDSPDVVAWHESNSGGSTHPVGQKQANGLGLYDMSGNVWEWCQDWFDKEYYTETSRNNPQGPSEGSNRVRRGGSWSYGLDLARAANRHGNWPEYRSHDLGFRLILSAR
jgi:formylglycine-generating enzyme required for sulfatase activity